MQLQMLGDDDVIGAMWMESDPEKKLNVNSPSTHPTDVVIKNINSAYVGMLIVLSIASERPMTRNLVKCEIRWSLVYLI